ncbi:hypothetical protein [Burkholderia alba]|uniref:hypothetical protein n=1 Tax=Burkholderia alba TaxID=2683677 RepID=UPI002B05445E|nr:hypothetical protein [Burkholderia alba]
MKTPVRIISIRLDCGAKPPREDHESIEVYAASLQKKLKRLMKQCVAAAFDAIAQVPGAGEPPRDVLTFVTAPEFYWNVPWTCIRDVAELRKLYALQTDPVRRCISEIAARFDPAQFGRIVFLPGTSAVLFETSPDDIRDPFEARHPSREPLEAPPLFESMNYVYAVSNFISPIQEYGLDEGLPRSVVAFKRHTSRIDYGYFLRETELTWTFGLGDGTRVEVKRHADLAPQSNTSQHEDGSVPLLTDGFDNRLGGVPPFGIDICLDFYKLMGSHHEPGHDFKAPNLRDPRYVIDFVLSYGVDDQVERFPLPASLRYTVHNDGRANRRISVFEIDHEARTRRGVPVAQAMQFLPEGARECVAIHEFSVDDGTPAPGGTTAGSETAAPPHGQGL